MMLTRVMPALLVLAACSSSGDDNGELAPSPLALVEELRLDPVAEDFSVVPDIGVGPRGRIAVLQPQDGAVRLYDSAGARIATIGRRGQGPGEFQFPARAGWIADSMWVIDIQLLRITWIAPDGSVLRTSALPENVAGSVPLEGDPRRLRFFLPIGVGRDGSLLGEAMLESRDPAARDERRTVVVRAPPGAPARIVGAFAARDEQFLMQVGGFRRSVPFSATPHTAFAPDVSRFAWLTTAFTDAVNGAFTLHVFDAQGDTALVRSYPFRGMPIPQSAKDSVLATFIAQRGRNTEGPPDLMDRYHAMAKERMPSAYPPVLAMKLGLDETIWLTLRDTADVRRALVLDGRGDPIGTFVLPPRATIRHGTKDRVWITQRDDDDLVSVVRYRLEAAR
jgi:hypothetical protein